MPNITQNVPRMAVIVVATSEVYGPFRTAVENVMNDWNVSLCLRQLYKQLQWWK